MNILHTIDSMSPTCGGTTTCTDELVRGLRACGICANILSRTERDHTFSPLRISPNLRRAIHRSRADIYHTHGLWLDVNRATCEQAKRRHVPCVYSLHGMLYPQALNRHALVKKWMMALYQRRLLEQASCLHVCSKQEMSHVRSLFPDNRIALIPLPVAEPQQLPEAESHSSFRVGYLGRLHPIKNLESLIRAWALLQLPNAELVIMGEGTPDYTRSLHRLAEQTDARGVVFTGFLSGDEKYRALASLDVYCAPSHQENFGMSIAEALLSGTPVLASCRTPWSMLPGKNCGSWQGNSPAELAEGLLSYYRLTADERRNMGKRGRKLIQEQFSTLAICKKMLLLYRYLLGESTKPTFVYE